MLSKIISYLYGRVDETGYFEKIYPLVEQVERDGIVYPAQYIGNGNYESVNNFDSYNGVAYFRLTTKQIINRPSPDPMSMCDEYIEMIFPLRLVGCVPKSKLSEDDAFADERISKTIISKLIIDGGSIKDELRASSFVSFPSVVTFDNRQILSEEYNNASKMKGVNYNYSYHAIDFTVTVKVKESCLTTECEEYYG